MKRFIILMFLLLCVPVFAQRKLTTNEATILAVGPFFDSTNGITPETEIDVTALTVEIYRELDDGSICTRFANFVPTASAGSNDMALITSSVSGMYSLEITAAQVNFTGFMQITIVDTDSAGIVGLPFFRSFIITAANVVDADYGTDKLQVDQVEVEGSDATTYIEGRTLAAADYFLFGSDDVAVVTLLNGLAGNVITAASIANAAIDAATFAADVDAEIAAYIWNAATASYGTANTYGAAVEDILADTAAIDTGAEWLGLLSAVDTDATSATHATTYVTLEAGKASNDAYNGMSIAITDAGDSNTETRRIEDYTSGRKVTFDRALSFTPVQNDIIRIYSMPYNIAAAIAGGTANTYIVTDTGAVGGTGIADVAVWLTIDSAGARLIVSGTTDDNGEVIFYLDSGITYYVWMSKSGYTFSDNGEAWVAD